MVRKAFFIVAALALIPSIAKAEFQTGDWELTLGGSGASNKGLTTGGIGVSGSLGYFFSKNLELGLRQSANYAKVSGAGDSFNGSTRGALDYHFDMGKLQPFVGVNGGYIYGSHHFPDSWEIGPEAGLKYFLNNTTFVFGLVEYQYIARNSGGSGFNHGSFVYSIGLGVALR